MRIWRTEEMPNEENSAIIPVPNKGDMANCEIYRGYNLSLI